MLLWRELPSYSLKIVGMEALAATLILYLMFSEVISSLNPGSICMVEIS